MVVAHVQARHRARALLEAGAGDEALHWLELGCGLADPELHDLCARANFVAQLDSEPGFGLVRLAVAGFAPAIAALEHVHPALPVVRGSPTQRGWSRELGVIDLGSPHVLARLVDELVATDAPTRRAASLVVFERLAVLERQWRVDSHTGAWDPLHSALKRAANRLLQRTNTWTVTHLTSLLIQLARTRYAHLMATGWLLRQIGAHAEAHGLPALMRELLGLAFHRSKTGRCADHSVEQPFYERVIGVFGGPVPRPVSISIDGLDAGSRTPIVDAAPAARALVEPLLSQLPREVAAAPSETVHSEQPALQAQLLRVLDDLDDDEQVAVYGDMLMDAGDPRGELIALQLLDEPTPKQERRIQALIRKHHALLAGPIARAATEHGYVRGFVTQCSIDGSHIDLFESTCEHPLWRGVEELTITGLTSLQPLAHLVGLHALTVRSGGNSLSDLGPLTGLQRLTELRMDHVRAGDLGPLASLANLEHLQLNWLTTGDITPLAELEDLQYLDLSCCPVQDLTPLAKLTNLTELHLQQTRVSDLSPLSGLDQLQRLKLCRSPVTDLSPLAALTNLEELWVSGTDVGDAACDSLEQALPELYIQR